MSPLRRPQRRKTCASPLLGADFDRHRSCSLAFSTTGRFSLPRLPGAASGSNPLSSSARAGRAAGASVTFQPGARTAWHTHPLVETLIVTAGCGWNSVRGRSGRGNPAGRCRLVSPRREALARGHADDGDRRISQFRKRLAGQDRRLDGEGERRAVPRVTENPRVGESEPQVSAGTGSAATSRVSVSSVARSNLPSARAGRKWSWNDRKTISVHWSRRPLTSML